MSLGETSKASRDYHRSQFTNHVFTGHFAMGVDKLFSIFVAAICVVMLVRLALGDARRARLDRGAIMAWGRIRRQALLVWHWRRKRRSAAQAKQAAQEVINRVRHRVEKEGNVLTPEAFKEKEPRKPH